MVALALSAILRPLSEVRSVEPKLLLVVLHKMSQRDLCNMIVSIETCIVN
jgi:hypothetical protein